MHWVEIVLDKTLVDSSKEIIWTALKLFLNFSAEVDHKEKVGPDGLEPSTHGLKVRCSTN